MQTGLTDSALAAAMVISMGVVGGMGAMAGLEPPPDPLALRQESQGLYGYIHMNVEKPPEGFGSGVSFYTPVWPLLEKPLSGFQIGLPSIWILPENRKFEEPLCPPGTPARDSMKERGPSFRDVFQTIEGGLGFWGSTQFGSTTAKYRMNGTSNCYAHEISSPGWGFGNTKPLDPDKMGLAQLSNRLLVPPDGLTFRSETFGEVFGTAWMALPIMERQARAAGSSGPVGDQCWTLFVSAANFRGAVAFWTPRTWTRVADNYRTAAGRTLDVRTGVIGGGAMEINTVPMFSVPFGKGVTYTRIPRLQFPIDAAGQTVMMQDFTLYSDDALATSFRSWSRTGWREGRFERKGSLVPKCTTGPISVTQGPGKTKIEGIEGTVETTMLGTSSYGLQWKASKAGGRAAAFPEYFKLERGKLTAIPASAVPDASGLKAQSFQPARVSRGYLSPTDEGTVWKTPGPKGEAITVTLTDGSLVTYAWYRFIDQPSIVSLKLPEAELTRLQKLVEQMHAKWTVTAEYMPPPSRGKLAVLDGAMVVTPPAGMEVGYVPIVLKQTVK
ncbi:MAG: hypothetical protein AABZ53_11060 [Planctomycetota bacterium]